MIINNDKRNAVSLPCVAGVDLGLKVMSRYVYELQWIPLSYVYVYL